MTQNNDDIDNAIETLRKIQVDLLKESLEYFGIDFGITNNQIDYRNYLVDNPLIFNTNKNNNNINVYPDDPTNNLHNLFKDSSVISNTGLSEGMLNFISVHENSHKFGYKMTDIDLNGKDLGDANGHKTYGYGLLYHPVKNQYMDSIKSSWTQPELENLFKIGAKKVSENIDKWATKNNITLKQNQKDAIASGCYNFGLKFLNNSICQMIKNDPNNPDIFKKWSHLSDAQGKKYPGLITRRQDEANWYFNNFA